MASVLRAFSVVACFLSGIYGVIIFIHFRNAKRMIWFSVLCFMLSINISICSDFSPFLHDTGYSSGIVTNIYLATYVFTTLALNVYSGLLLPARLSKFNLSLTYFLFLLASACMLIPDNYKYGMFIVVCVTSLVVYLISFFVSMYQIKAGQKIYIYPAIAYILFFVQTVAGLVLLLFNIPFTISRTMNTPVFLILHIIMILRQYKISIDKTKKLSASLSDTIERINHSDNALMCTQMKADFLYKSLDLICEKCDEDPFAAEDLTVSLSKYLRHTLNFQQLKGIVPLTNEIELTKSFIAIERERYPKLSVEYKFPNPLPEFFIPPLSIQPLVENAIEHAFDWSEPSPRITITIIPYRDYYHIDISDNGKGMDEDMSASLTDILCDSARIGIYNIHTRLISLFGKGLVIQSAPGVGTSISFVVPPDAKAYIEEREAKNA